MTTKNWQDYATSPMAAAIDLVNDDILLRDKSNTTDHATEGTVLACKYGAALGPLNHVCQGRLTLASGYPVYAPAILTPSATDHATNDTCDFASAHSYVTGMMATVATTVGGLTAGTVYYVRAVDSDTISFHTSFAGSVANSAKVNLSANITSAVIPLGLQSTSVYFTPHNGNLISLYDGTRWKLFSFTERSYLFSGGQQIATTPYDIFLYDNAGTLALELITWTNDTTRATALTTQDGVYVKSGATTRRYLGTLRGISTSICEDSWYSFSASPKCFLWNAYNQIQRPVAKFELTDSWTYTTATLRQANASATNQIEVVAGLAGCDIDLSLSAKSTGTAQRITAIGEDSTSAMHLLCRAAAQNTSGVTTTGTNVSGLRTVVPLGYHYYSWLEYSIASGTTTWYGDNSNSLLYQNGLAGAWKC